MRADFYVYSTMTAGNDYVCWEHSPANELPEYRKENTVSIAGGHGVANKNLITPLGVMTPITAAQHELLQSNEVFKVHQKAGFITVQKRSVDPEKVAADLETRDKSAPLVPQDFEKKGDKVAKPVLDK